MDERPYDDSDVSNPTTRDAPAGERPPSEGLPDPRRPVKGPPTTSETGEKSERTADRSATASSGSSDDGDASMKERTKQEAQRRAEELRTKGHEAADRVKREAERRVDEQTSRAATTLESVERALHEAARELDGDGHGRLAGVARQAAGQVDRMKGYLDEESAPGMLSDLEETARSNPATFLGISFATGLALGRFLRASDPGPDGGDVATRSIPGRA